jgi:hypothetical protein
MWFTPQIRGRKPGRKHARSNRFLPRPEIFEDRTLPSALNVLNNFAQGPGSLRDAIADATSGDTIVFDPSLAGQTIALTGHPLTINKSLDIEGPGASLLAISGNDTDRVFDIEAGLSVTIAGLTIAHGRAAGRNGGGGILNEGSVLALANDVFSNNEAVGNNPNSSFGGGAITNLTGATLTITGSTFVANEAIGATGGFGEGGAIWNQAAACISASTFTGNQAFGGNGGTVTSAASLVGIANGGAIFNQTQGATLNVANSTFTANQAMAGNCGSGGRGASTYSVDGATGGGLTNAEGATLDVSGCTFAYNQVIGGSNATGGSSGQGSVGTVGGGGLANLNGAVAMITDTTFDHNQALGGSDNRGGGGFIIIGAGRGGGIANFAFGLTSTLAASNCRFTSNDAVGGSDNTGGSLTSDGIGGGLANQGGSTATVMGSVFTGNKAAGGQGGTARNGGDGLGGGIANILGSPLTVSNCALADNQAVGGAGGVGANGGNGFGGGNFNDGLSIWPTNGGTPANLTITGSTIMGNQAIGGAAGSGGTAGLGEGGGLYLAGGSVACLDMFTQAHTTTNHATTDHDDIFGSFATC